MTYPSSLLGYATLMLLFIIISQKKAWSQAWFRDGKLITTNSGYPNSTLQHRQTWLVFCLIVEIPDKNAASSCYPLLYVFLCILCYKYFELYFLYHIYTMIFAKD